MAVKNVNKEITVIIILCLLWYATSSCNNLIGKIILNDFPYPMTVTIVQLLSITIYSGPVLKCMGVKPRIKSDISWSYYKKIILPLAFGKALATVFSHISLWKVPVSYAHTVKATMPLFTVILSRIFIGERQSSKVYFSLLPIIIGVAIASITEISFDTSGLIAALVATGAFSLLHIYSKKVMNDIGIHHLRLLHLLGKLALLLFFPVWLICDVLIFWDSAMIAQLDHGKTLGLLFIDGLLNWLQNFLAFTILSHVTPVTYAVANASKRICVIALSLFVLGNPVTSMNVMGMFLAIFGVLGYNKTKYDENAKKKKAALVPLSQVVAAKSSFSHFQNGFEASNHGLPNGTLLPVVDSVYRQLPHPLQVAPFDISNSYFVSNSIHHKDLSNNCTAPFHNYQSANNISKQQK